MTLNSHQRKYLESLANALQPTVRIGKGGIGENMLLAVREAFNKKELIKVKILDTSAATPQEVADFCVEKAGATLVRTIGRVVILYKPFEENPVIILP
ncbi:MAG: YhbY family RNA-binding protein [Candidatus Riflebacteria bacterium]|nr:YhbY family RNA-binding protein [Candidatus Riflebacteria bacterium]